MSETIVTRDPETDALYITLSKRPIVRTITTNDPRVLIDLDSGNQIVGIEVL